MNESERYKTASSLELLIIFVAVGLLLAIIGFEAIKKINVSRIPMEPAATVEPILDTATYDEKLLQLAHAAEISADQSNVAIPSAAAESLAEVAARLQAGAQSKLWPVEAPYPRAEAILPFKRIVAYYGNFLSKGMGVLGEYSEEVVLSKLATEVAAWEAADPTTPVLPAIDHITIVAQYGPGTDGKYRLRMPTEEIDKAIALAERAKAIVILEVQAGLSDLMTEIRTLENYLTKPQVHLAIDPEFAMVRSGGLPGRRVGQVDAADVNEAVAYLSDLVRTHKLPPKVLVVHRYTKEMVSNATKIKPSPEVQIIMNMDGWGPPANKFGTYNSYIYPEPVQFTGFKIFYKNDIRIPGSKLLTPAEVLKLKPQPSYIQYQ